MNAKAFREDVLPLVLPALLIGAAYLLVPQMGTWAQSINPTARRDRLETAMKGSGPVPSEAEIARAQGLAIEARGTLDGTRAQKAQLEKKWQELVVRVTSPTRRTEVTALVEEHFGYHDLKILEQAPVETADNQIPASLKAAVTRLAEKVPSHKAELIRFRVVGKYGDVLNALEALSSKKGWGAIPVGLGMDEANLKNDERTWTLLLWI